MEAMPEPETSLDSLQSQLDAHKENWAENAEEALIALYEEGVRAVAESGVVSKARQVGDSAPNFILTNAVGKTVEFHQELQKGPVVLVWYRGKWCPYCNLTLKALQRHLTTFQDMGAQLIALTPELPDKSLSTAERHALQYEILNDKGNAIARRYGIVYELPADVAARYQASFDLHGYNGDDSNELPLACTYVVDREAIIRYAFLDPEYRRRAEPTHIIATLKHLQQS